MLKIRLARMGKKDEPHYRIVVSEARSKRGGKNVAILGHWSPLEDKFVVDKKSYEAWLGRGAQPTTAVAKLIK